MRIVRPDWTDYFLNLAHAVAARTSCPRVIHLGGVGAVLVGSNHRVLGIGYCGAPPGQPQCDEEGCLIVNGGCVRTVHAELNALLHAQSSQRPKTLYCTLSPCMSCFNAALAAGVDKIIYATEYRIVEPQQELALKAGVQWVHVPQPWADPLYKPAPESNKEIV